MNGKPEDFIGRNIMELFGEGKGAIYIERIQRSITSDTLIEYEDLVELPGKTKWFLSVFNYVKDETSKESGVLIFSHDITERKQTETALHLVNRKLSLFSSITRHDMNNQLMALNGQLSLLEKELEHASPEGHLIKAKAAAERITTMINFTKEYEDIGQNVPAWQEVHSLIERCVKDVHLGSIRLQNDVPIGVEIFADQMIVKAFSNLVDNAVRHGGTAAHIRFHMEDQDGTRDILSITNIGIKEEGKIVIGARFVMSAPPGGIRKK